MNSFCEANLIFTVSAIMLVKKTNETNWSCPLSEEWMDLGGPMPWEDPFGCHQQPTPHQQVIYWSSSQDVLRSLALRLYFEYRTCTLNVYYKIQTIFYKHFLIYSPFTEEKAKA